MIRPGRIVAILSLALLSLATTCSAQVSSLAPPPTPAAASPREECVPGRVLVKLKPDTADLVSQSGPRVGTLSRSLRSVFTRHRVAAANPLFPGLRADRGGLRATEHASQVRAQFSKRASRATLAGSVPDLENIFVLDYASGEAPAAVAAELKTHPEVVYAEPDLIVHTTATPNDPYFSSTGSWGQSYADMWGLQKINAPAAWDVTTGSDSVLIAVVDTGLDTTHPDLAGRFVSGWNFVNNSADVTDGYGHGTHVSGTIAAATNNGIGVAGIDWSGKILPVKGLDNTGSGTTSVLAQAMEYAADQGADVMNNSWGGSGCSQTLQDAVNYAYGLGCIVVAAAGNDSSNTKYYSPAGLQNVVCVAATDATDAVAWFSNYGTLVDVSAPGVDVLSLRASGTDLYHDGTHIVATNYYRASGTSMACPHAVGVLGLLLAAHPTWSTADIISQLDGTTDNIDTLNDGYEGLIGTGRINAGKAVGGTASGERTVLYSFTFDDSLGNGDGWAQAGERLQLTVTLKHFTGATSNVTATLTTSDPYISFVTNSASWGPVSGWRLVDNAAHPFVFDISSACPELHTANFTVTITAPGYTESENISIPVSMYLPGWPVAKGGVDRAYPVLADVDGDGEQETIVYSGRVARAQRRWNGGPGLAHRSHSWMDLLVPDHPLRRRHRRRRPAGDRVGEQLH